MNLLVDTHALIWWMEDSPRLSPQARSALSDADSAVFVSAATVWEIEIKRYQGRLNVPNDLSEQIALNGWLHLPITLPHAVSAGSLPRHHRDPFDRALVAQALAEGLTIVTRDPLIARYDVPILRA